MVHTSRTWPNSPKACKDNPRQPWIGDSSWDGRTGTNTSDQETKHDQGTKSGGTRWTNTDLAQRIIGRVPAQISILSKTETQTRAQRFKQHERRVIADKGGTGEGGDGVGRGKTRQDNQYRKKGDGEATRGETTDPTYSLADMIIGVLSY